MSLTKSALDRNPPGPEPAARSTLPDLGLLQIGDLKRMPVARLRELARAEGLPGWDELKKNDLVLDILRHTISGHGVMFGEGVLEVLPDGFGFLRSTDYSYLPSPDDVYVSAPLIQRHRLRTGLMVGGQVRPPRENERYCTLIQADQVQHRSIERHRPLPCFDDLTALHPDRHLRLETRDPARRAMRIVDLLAPIGFGQRGLIVAPPRTGKTVLLQQMAQSIAENHPTTFVLVLLIDERPEEVTDFARSVDAEVIASTFDEPPARHVQVAEMVLEKAKRLVEYGHDVVVLLDSITRLGRAYNAEAPTSGKILTGGIDASALQRPKHFFGAARNVEEGGSLTVLATALVDTGSRMDEVIFEEFKGTGNMELVLDRGLAERRIYPAVDVQRSGTRMEDLILDDEQLRLSWILRRLFAEMRPYEALELLCERVARTRDNRELLADMTR
jgi:transcription termination factor Rho